MKSPISYYGGKATLAKRIVEKFPSGYQDMVYIEPFFGGGSVFFEKQPSKLEVLNDTNRKLITFYKVMQNDFTSLEKEVRISLHSREMYRDALAIYDRPHLFNDVKLAWAVWALANQGFGSMLGASWGYDKTGNTMPKKLKNRREAFTEDYAIRLQNVSLESTDALKIIRSRDSKNTFVYADPPYFNSDCGHYDGYTIDDFEALLKLLSEMEGKFMLSSYPSPILAEYTKKNGWYNEQYKMAVAVQNTSAKPKKQKVEVITTNYKF